MESGSVLALFEMAIANCAYEITAADAIKHQDAVAGYNSSKKLAEQAAWKFVEEQKPCFDLTVINPDIIIGPMIQPVPKPSSVNATTSFAVYSFFNGTNKKIEGVTFPFYHFVSKLKSCNLKCLE